MYLLQRSTPLHELGFQINTHRAIMKLMKWSTDVGLLNTAWCKII